MFSTHNNFSCPVTQIEWEKNYLNDDIYLSQSITNILYENIMNSQGVTKNQKEKLEKFRQDFMMFVMISPVVVYYK